MILITAAVIPLNGKISELKKDIEYIDKNLVYNEYFPGASYDPNICYYISDQVIVGFESSVDVSTIFKIDGHPIIDCIDSMNAVLVETKDVDLELFINQVNDRKDVRYAELNLVAFGCDVIPDDEFWDEQWGHVMINCPYAWDITTGKDVWVAVLDTGIDTDHEDFCSGKILWGENVINETNVYEDDHGHGTRCSGIIGACFNNGIGIAGVAPDCNFIPVKVLNQNATGSVWTVVKGVLWATYYGLADIISMSLGIAGSSKLLKDVCTLAYDQGKVLIAAAGNYNANRMLYPANYSTVIAVGAIDENKNRWNHSNYGENLDFVAPGVNIITTNIGNNYAYSTGTSASTAYVSGVVALYMQLYPDETPEFYKNILIDSIEDLPPDGWDEETGYGLVYFNELPPTDPVITGPTSGTPGTLYTYTFSSTDPDGDDISYYIIWKAGVVTQTPFQASGTEYSENMSWPRKGTYKIYAKAIDMDGAESDWSEFIVTMPRNRLIENPLLQFLQNHLKLFPFLRQLLSI